MWVDHQRIDMVAFGGYCGTQRLYLANILPEEEQIIYVDNDFLFMGAPEVIWEHFRGSQNYIARMAPNIDMWYPEFSNAEVSIAIF